MPIKTLIMGAAGRDFHNFNVAYRDRADCEVVAFTGTQIPGIAGRRYPAVLAGTGYPDGIPIHEEERLEEERREGGAIAGDSFADRHAGSPREG